MCLLISGPDKLPNNINCILLSLFSYFLVAMSLVDETHGYLNILSQLVLELVFLSLITYVGLRWRKTLPRFYQTLSALIGVNLIISAISIPVYQSLVQDASSTSELNQTAINVTVAIVLWNLAVLSLIFKRAFEINTLLSAMVSFNYFFVYQFIIVWFY